MLKRSVVLEQVWDNRLSMLPGTAKPDPDLLVQVQQKIKHVHPLRLCG
jgi:hypothetical protein